MSKRNDLRAIALGSKEFKKEIVEYGGVEFEVRQPSQGGRREVFKKAKDAEGVVDGFEFMLWSVIFNTFSPDTNERVFEDADYKTISNQPAGGLIDKLGEVAGKLMGTEDDIEKK